MSTFNSTQGKAVGTLVFGKYEVRGLSAKQQDFILKLLATRNYDASRIPTEVDGSINIKQASRIIDYLLSCPQRDDVPPPPPSEKQLSYVQSLIARRQDPDNKVASTNLANREQVSALIEYLKLQPEKELNLEVGAYELDGIYYSVRKTENGYWYAIHFVDGQWSGRDYKIVRSIDPANRLTFEQAREFGVNTGSCVYCQKTLTDAKSISMGMGDWCFKKHHKGLRAELKHSL